MDKDVRRDMGLYCFPGTIAPVAIPLLRSSGGQFVKCSTVLVLADRYIAILTAHIEYMPICFILNNKAVYNSAWLYKNI
jgi:hypothetical protein